MADSTAKSTHTIAEIDAAVDAVPDKVDKAEGYSLMSDAEHSTLAEVYGTTALEVPDSIKIPENTDLNDIVNPGVYKAHHLLPQQL